MSEDILDAIALTFAPMQTVLSTPSGGTNKFFEMMQNSKSTPRITINKSRRMGRSNFLLAMEETLRSPWFTEVEKPIRPLANILAFWDYDKEIDWRPNESIAEDYYA
jgi:hypothetical protein